MKTILFAVTLIAVGLAMMGCSGSAPVVRYEAVETVRTVPVVCLTKQEIPARPAPLREMPMDARDALNAALYKLTEYADYADVADPLLRACADQ